MAFFRAGNTNQAIVTKQLDSLMALATRLGDTKLYWQMALAKKTSDIYANELPADYPKSLKKLEPWVNNCPEPEVKAAYNCTVGSFYLERHLYADGFALMLKGIKEFEDIGFDKIPEIGYYLNQLGNNYYHFKDYDKALYYLELSEKYEPILPRFKFDNLNTQGLALQNKNDFTKANEKFFEGLEESEKYGDTVWVGIISGNLGHLFSKMGQYNKAIFYLKKDYNYNKITEPDNTAFSCIYLAEAYLNDNHPDSAYFFSQEAVRLQTPALQQNALTRFSMLAKYYKIMGNYFRIKGNPALGFKYQDSCIVANDSLIKNNNAQIIYSAEQHIQTERYQNKLDLLQQEQANAVLKRNLWIALAMAGLFFLTALIAYQRQQSQKSKLVFLEKEAAIRKEKETTEKKLVKSEQTINEYIKMVTSKNELLEILRTELQQATEIKNDNHRNEKLNELLQFSLLTDDQWAGFKKLFDAQFPGFSVQLKNKLPWLSPAETRLMLLLKLNLNSKEISYMLGIAQASVNKLKYRFRKRLNDGIPSYHLEEILETWH